MADSQTTDTERLDWLERNGLSAKMDKQGLWHIAPGLAIVYHVLAKRPENFQTMREAIDAAMASLPDKPFDQTDFVTDLHDPRLAGGTRFVLPAPDPKYSFWNVQKDESDGE